MSSFAKGYNARHIFSACPAQAFLGSSVKEGLAPAGALAYIKRPYSFGAVYLVSRYGEKVNPQVIDIHRYFTKALNSVGMEYHSPGVGQLPYFLNGHYGAHLVVGVHNCNKYSLIGYSGCNIFNTDHAVLVHRQCGYGKTFLTHSLDSIQHCVVLHRRCDDVVSFVFVGMGHPVNGHIIGLGSPAGKNNLVGGSSNGPGHFLPGFLHALPDLPAKIVQAGGVAKVLFQVSAHSLYHLRTNRRGGAVVEVNPAHRICLLISDNLM